MIPSVEVLQYTHNKKGLIPEHAKDKLRFL
jgi:hypothetical protein